MVDPAQRTTIAAPYSRTVDGSSIAAAPLLGGSIMPMPGRLALFEQVLDPSARAGEVHAPAVALFQRAPYVADLPGAAGTFLFSGGLDRRSSLSLTQLLGQKLLDDGDLGRFLVCLRLAAGPLVDGERFAPLLDHPVQQGRDLSVWDRLFGGDIGLLQGGGD